MKNPTRGPELPARTHADAAVLFRRPFAPGAIGFRAMIKVPYNGDPGGGAHVAAYLSAQSVLQRLNAVVPGRWRMEFKLLQASNGATKRYMNCRLIVTLPVRPGGREAEAVYEDVGELEIGSPAGLKALYSDARKRAGVAAGIGAYLYTALRPVVLPVGPEDRQVQVQPRPGGEDLLVLSPATEEWLREDYARQMSADAARRDLGEILSHGEPACSIGHREAVEKPSPSPADAFWDGGPGAVPIRPAAGSPHEVSGISSGESSPEGNGVVHVNFSGPGPDAA
jgi:hypothetical protein